MAMQKQQSSEKIIAKKAKGIHNKGVNAKSRCKSLNPHKGKNRNNG